ncbi:MAG: acylphosphatase [Acidobacteria bacterium]|nr:MAG: acylphosphatase [Acidobacteriota bacterium]REK07819.1 MAG: acylphosphatase [Acidobacteriota bacterium]
MSAGTDRIVHGLVSGRVQGVYYRASFQRECEARGLVGWVRNLHDGRVEFRIRGSEDAVDAALQWARSGPPAARVEGLETWLVEAADDELSGDAMRVLATASRPVGDGVREGGGRERRSEP